MDIDSLFQDLPIPKNETDILGLVGLHCCGDLTPTLIDLFLNCQKIKTLVCVGCCFNRLTLNDQGLWNPLSTTVKRSLGDLKLGEFALRLSCDSAHTWANTSGSDQESMLRLTYHRMLLQYYLWDSNDRCGCEYFTPRKSKPRNDFGSYARWGMSRLRIKKSESCTKTEHKNSIEDQDLISLNAKFEKGMEQVAGFLAVRSVLSPVLETLVLLDRFLYMKERGVVADIFPLFDSTLSPRNMVIVARKS
eukprot:TRINITY_DN10028_c0_g1_i1.p1 TRINITY_DN10028_c0_g1~~TRINITY_DN10028_c0_g1_i1.p1  ORF type:complete len:248 (+),score=25.52 TRINITY_DN10028_c0_g1_i1:196-939(+)